jgi:hypothetical protein
VSRTWGAGGEELVDEGEAKAEANSEEKEEFEEQEVCQKSTFRT